MYGRRRKKEPIETLGTEKSFKNSGKVLVVVLIVWVSKASDGFHNDL